MGSLADRVQLLEQNSMLSELNVRVGSMEDRLRELAANAEAARMAAEAARSMAEESTMQSETRARRLQVDVDSKVPMDMLESVVLQKVGAAIAKEKEGTKKIKSAIKRIFSYLEDTVNPELGRLRKDVDEMRELLVHKGLMVLSGSSRPVAVLETLIKIVGSSSPCSIDRFAVIPRLKCPSPIANRSPSTLHLCILDR